MGGIMKKVLALSITALFVSATAFAQGFGLGWDNGVSVRGMVNSVTIQGTLGFQNWSPENDNADSYTTLNLAGYAAFPIIDMGESTMNVFGGLGIGTRTDYDMDIALRGGLQHDVYVTDNISVSGKAGLELMMEGGQEDIDDSGWTGLGTWGTVGIYWWFK